MSGASHKVLVVGARGLATEAAWVAREMSAAVAAAVRWQIVGFTDEDPSWRGKKLGQESVLGPLDEAIEQLGKDTYFHIAIGNNAIRRKVAAQLEALGWKAATLVHPSVVRAPDARLGAGCYIGAGSVLAPCSELGDHVIVNTLAGIGHHSRLASFVNVCPGARISGECRVDEGALIGSNAVLNPGISVGARATVGAASLAIRDVPAGSTVIGVPARAIGPVASGGGTA